MPTLVNKIQIENHIGQNLSIRDLADELFDCIDSHNNTEFIIDFKDVYTTSRSFVHQFIYRMKISQNKITCINESYNIKKMFEIVSTSKDKKQVVKSKQVFSI